MDYKFKQSTIVVSVFSILMIVLVVIIANWKTISKHSSSQVSNSSTSDVVETEEIEIPMTSDTFFGGTRLGNDLSAWKNDPAFFNGEYLDKTTGKIENTDVSDNESKKDASTNDVSQNDGQIGSDMSISPDEEDGLKNRNSKDN